jgi:hypothetical protein
MQFGKAFQNQGVARLLFKVKLYFISGRFNLKTLYCLDYDSWLAKPPEIEGEFDSDVW